MTGPRPLTPVYAARCPGSIESMSRALRTPAPRSALAAALTASGLVRPPLRTCRLSSSEANCSVSTSAKTPRSSSVERRARSLRVAPPSDRRTDARAFGPVPGPDREHGVDQGGLDLTRPPAAPLRPRGGDLALDVRHDQIYVAVGYLDSPVPPDTACPVQASCSLALGSPYSSPGAPARPGVRRPGWCLSWTALGLTDRRAHEPARRRPGVLRAVLQPRAPPLTRLPCHARPPLRGAAGNCGEQQTLRP